MLRVIICDVHGLTEHNQPIVECKPYKIHQQGFLTGIMPWVQSTLLFSHSYMYLLT